MLLLLNGLQVIFFFMPRYLWKASENGKVAMLVGNLQEPLLSASDKEGQINEIVKYFRMHRGTHSLYAARFFLLEVVNFINVILAWCSQLLKFIFDNSADNALHEF